MSNSGIAHTMLSKALEKGSDNHEHRSTHDRPSSTEALVHIGSEWNGENGSKLVARRNETEKARFDCPLQFTLVVLGLITISKVCLCQF